MSDVRLWTFAGFRIRDIIDVDLVSTTYRTTIVGGDQPRRLRVFTTETGDDIGIQASAIAQARAVADLDHPHLLAIREADVHDDRLYVVSDDVAGRILREYVIARHPVPPRTMVAMGWQLAGALDAVHAAGLVHGSINPHAIWVGDDTRAGDDAPSTYLTGFAASALLSRRIRDQGNAPASDDVLYLAPEQIHTDRATPEADRYALACALYHVVSGVPPFRRGSVDALLRAQQLDPVEPLATIRDGLPVALDAVFRRALAKQSTERYPSAHALLVDVERAVRAQAGVPATARRRNGDGVSPTVQRSPQLPHESNAAGNPDDASGGAATPLAATAVVAAAAAPTADAPAVRSDDAPGVRSDDAPGVRSDDAPGVRSDDVPAVPSETATAAGVADGADAPTARADASAAAGALSWARTHARILTPAALAVVALLLLALTLAGGRDDAGQDAAHVAADDPAGVPDRAGQPADDAPEPDAEQVEVRPSRSAPVEPTVVAPLWSTPLAGTAIRDMIAADQAVFVDAGRTIGALDPSSGEPLWTHWIGARARDVAVADGVAVVASKQELTGYDLATGDVRWRAAVTLDRLATDRREIYAADRFDWGIALTAVTAADGTVRPLGGIADPDTKALALQFDDSSGAGGRTLYALTAGALHAFDPDTGTQAWRAPVDPDGAAAPPTLGQRPWVGSLHATGGAVFVVGRDGRLCRYAGRTGLPAWRSCRAVAGPPNRSPTIGVHAGMAVVSGQDATSAYDVSTGMPAWTRWAGADARLEAAGGPELTYVAGGDRLLRALDHASGVERWRATDLGPVTALLSDADGVYVGGEDGAVTRVALRALGGSDDG